MSTPCQICERIITGEGDDTEIYSLGRLDVVCSDCHSSQAKCAECRTHFQASAGYCISGTDICSVCYNGASTCYECSERILAPSHSILDSTTDHLYCNTCADETPSYECEQCDVQINVIETSENSGYDYLDERLCMECYEQKINTVWIGDFTGNRLINKSTFDAAYQKIGSYRYRSAADSEDLTGAQKEDILHARMYYRVFDEYYENYEHLDHNNLILRKSAFGYGRRGWYESKIEVKTPLATKITRMLDYLICESGNDFYRPHKKLGRIQPFQELFSSLCHFYIRNRYFMKAERERVEYRYPLEEITEYKQLWTDGLRDCENDDERMQKFQKMSQQYGAPYVDFYVDHLSRDELRKCVMTRKLPDGRPLIKTVNKIINTMEKQMRNDDSLKGPWQVLESYKKNVWDEYCTNGTTVNLPVSIGFGPNAHNKVQSFNEQVGSCQAQQYIEGLGFNHISMQSNPHLFLLIHSPTNPETIIGRSVIRFWYEHSGAYNSSGLSEINYDKLIVAPSRLYLSEYTHVKRDIYKSMFDVVREWIDVNGQYFKGGENAEIVAYCRTKHDDYSVASYLRNSIDAGANMSLSSVKEMNLATEFYYPIWIDKPDTDSLWTYYNDEYQTSQLARVDKSEISSFAIRETYEGSVRVVEKQE